MYTARERSLIEKRGGGGSGGYCMQANHNISAVCVMYVLMKESNVCLTRTRASAVIRERVLCA